MKTPPWLAAELDTLLRRHLKGDLTQHEAITAAVEAIESKDLDLVVQIHYEWTVGRFQDALARTMRKAAGEADRKAASTRAGYAQPTLDDDLFEGPDSTLLTADGEYAYDLLGRAERHHKRADRRVAVYEQRVAAVGGNQDGKATRGHAKEALRRASGDAAAEG